MKRTYQKITIGFVNQIFEENDEGQFVCTQQTFEASDEVSREDENGNVIDENEVLNKEVYFPFHLDQPEIIEK